MGQKRFAQGRRIIFVPFHLKVLSYFQPVSLGRSASDVSGYLELLLYRNQFQLLTDGAFYSDGVRYFPAVAVVRHLKEFLRAATHVLVLGAGLGSLVAVMHARGYDPRYTLVEKDKTVFGWASKILGQLDARKLAFVCVDAESFMAQNERKYDLIFVDLFAGRTVPDFVTTPRFLMQCHDSLSPGGRLAFNYIEADKQAWEKTQRTFAGVFPDYHIVRRDDNRILISSPPAAEKSTRR